MKYIGSIVCALAICSFGKVAEARLNENELNMDPKTQRLSSDTIADNKLILEYLQTYGYLPGRYAAMDVLEDIADDGSLQNMVIRDICAPVGAQYICSQCGGTGKALFTTAFVQNNGTPFITFSGAVFVQSVCSFYYGGSNTVPISSVTVILSSGVGTPTGTITITTPGGATVATIAYSGLTSTPTVFSTTAITNLPAGASVLNCNITVSGSPVNKVNIYSLTVQ
jgi:hypothetical protein